MVAVKFAPAQAVLCVLAFVGAVDLAAMCTRDRGSSSSHVGALDVLADVTSGLGIGAGPAGAADAGSTSAQPNPRANSDQNHSARTTRQAQEGHRLQARIQILEERAQDAEAELARSRTKQTLTSITGSGPGTTGDQAETTDVGVVESKDKQDCEMGYWESIHQKEKGSTSQEASVDTRESASLGNSHYKTFYTVPFGVDMSFYANQKILDVGCGPRGSLEFLKGTASAAVCADPLADQYSHLGAWAHSMVYVSAGVEKLPFASNSFQIISSMNNLDHVTNLALGLQEMRRVLQPGGKFIVAVEIHPIPTPCEPLFLGWDFAKTVVNNGFTLDRERWWIYKKTLGVHSKSDVMWTEPPNPSSTVVEIVRNGTSKEHFGWFVGIFTKA